MSLFLLMQFTYPNNYKQWKEAVVVPKKKLSDTFFDGKLKLFDEDGEEVASQG